MKTKRHVGRPEADKNLIIKVLKEAYPTDLTTSEIADSSGLHRNTVSKHLKRLVKERRVVLSRERGVWKFYRLNKK